MAQVNKYNFLRWTDSNPSSEQPDLPHPYWWDREHCGYMPKAYPTEALAFYVNTAAGSNYGTFSNMRLRMKRADTGATVDNNISGLAQHIISGANYNFYATIVVPAAATPGVHYFEIYNNSGGAIILTSGYVYVRTDKTNLDNETVFVRFKHDRTFYNIKYHEIPSFYQQFRLDINILERQVDTDDDIYNEVTTGKKRRFNNYLNRFHKVEAYYFDPPAHEAASIMVEHATLEFNGKIYSKKATYKEPADPRNKLGKGEFEVWEEEFGAVNRC